MCLISSTVTRKNIPAAINVITGWKIFLVKDGKIKPAHGGFPNTGMESYKVGEWYTAAPYWKEKDIGPFGPEYGYDCAFHAYLNEADAKSYWKMFEEQRGCQIMRVSLSEVVCFGMQGGLPNGSCVVAKKMKILA